jgi:hypothetical protein
MPGLAALAIGAIAAFLAPQGHVADAARAVEALGPPQLIAELTRPAAIRRAPRADSRVRLRLDDRATFSGGPQGLRITAKRRDDAGRWWYRVQLPVRPNGAEGWVSDDDVRLRSTYARFVVRLAARTLEIWDGTRRVARFPAGIGRPGTPTPTGDFAIQDPLYTGATKLRHTYGAWTLILTAHSEALDRFNGGDALIGIHGAGDGLAWRVGRAASNGCVILSEPDLAVAAKYAWPGTPVKVLA